MAWSRRFDTLSEEQPNDWRKQSSAERITISNETSRTCLTDLLHALKSPRREVQVKRRKQTDRSWICSIFLVLSSCVLRGFRLLVDMVTMMALSIPKLHPVSCEDWIPETLHNPRFRPLATFPGAARLRRRICMSILQ
jgi:hypothetical protein